MIVIFLYFCLIIFSNRPYCKIFHLTNKGRRHQQLVWSMDGFSPIAKAKKEMQSYNPLDMKFRVSEIAFAWKGASAYLEISEGFVIDVT